MKIVVLGATGSTGQLFISAALAHGHEVLAVVRRTGVLQAQPRLTIVQASVEDAAQLQSSFSGADAVVSCLGQRPNLRAFCLGSDFQRRSMPAIVAACNAAQVPRFLLLSSFGSGSSARQAGWFLRTFLYGLIAKKMFDDKAWAEESMRTCQAHWTAIYPVTLVQKPALPAAACALVELNSVAAVPGIPRLPFANVALSLLQLLEEKSPAYAGQKLLLAPKGSWRAVV